MNVRTLIVDDEPLARERLRQLLQPQPGIELIGECSDGQQALAAIQQQKPDLVFLDIQMPELDGFQVLEAIPSPRPAIVFVTAYDEFAVRAFEVHAVDYLLKPFNRDRFQLALTRAIEQVQHSSATAREERQAALLAELKPPTVHPDRIAVKSGGRVALVKVAEIEWVQAGHNYVELHENTHTHLLRETLGALEKRLPPEKFVRISRSVIVNLDRVKELQPLFWGEYAVILQNGTRLTLSRRYRSKLPRFGLG